MIENLFTLPSVRNRAQFKVSHLEVNRQEQCKNKDRTSQLPTKGLTMYNRDVLAASKAGLAFTYQEFNWLSLFHVRDGKPTE